MKKVKCNEKLLKKHKITSQEQRKNFRTPHILSYYHRKHGPYLERRALHTFLFRYAKVFSTLLSDWLIFNQKIIFCWLPNTNVQMTLFCSAALAFLSRFCVDFALWKTVLMCTYYIPMSFPTLVVRPTRRSTLGDRAFPVAAARAWNSLPPAVRDAPSLLSSRSRMKTWLFELTL